MPIGFAKIGLIGGLAEAQYEGTNVSADLLWHLKKIPVSQFNTNYDITTGNGYESNGINVGGTTYDANIIVYDGNNTFGAGNIGTSGDKLALLRINGDLTISAGFTLTTSGTTQGFYIFVDGDLTVNGSISTYNKGRYKSGGLSNLAVNSSANEVAGSTVISMTGSASAHTNGSSTASALTVGGGGQGGSGSYGGRQSYNTNQ